MTRGKARIHLDASTPDLRRALCGWTLVDTETDLTKVTCKACLSRYASSRAPTTGQRKAGKVEPSAADVASELRAAFAATLAPTASATPQLTVQVWAASCKGAEHRRCGECAICVWEREAELWAAVSPWNRTHELVRVDGAPRWSSLAAALCAFAEWERHDRHSPSALGGILDRVRRGDAGGQDCGTRTEDPLLRRAGELVRVRQALDLAYPEGAHVLPAAKCKAVLFARTPGVVGEMPTYDALAIILGIAEGELRALVREGRRRLTAELAARGLIPLPRLNVRTSGRSSVRVPAGEMQPP